MEVEISFYMQFRKRITLLNVTFFHFQSGLPAMNVEILSQFPSPPVPNLPALAMAMATVMPQHQQPMMNNPPISMAIPTPAPPVMQMATVAPTQAPTNTSFITSFPPAQVRCFNESCFILNNYDRYYIYHLTNDFLGNQSRRWWLPRISGGSKVRVRRPGLYWVPRRVCWKFPHSHCTPTPKQVHWIFG